MTVQFITRIFKTCKLNPGSLRQSSYYLKTSEFTENGVDNKSGGRVEKYNKMQKQQKYICIRLMAKHYQVKEEEEETSQT